MKNTIYYVLFVALVTIVACNQDNKVEPIFDKTINERTDELKSEYIEALSKPENGWVGYYSPNSEVGTYTLLLKFNEDGSVLMHSDYNEGANDAQITYRIDKTLKMELVFESHSVLHQIYETDQNGIGGEYVFNISSINENEAVLVSKTDNGYSEEPTELHLKKATSTDWDVTSLYSSLQNIVGDGTKSVFRNVLISDIPVASFTFNADKRNATISYLEGGKLVTVLAPISINTTGFSFINALTISGVTLSGFVYDVDTDAFVDATNNAKILYDNVPALPLTPYAFGAKNNLRFNDFEINKSSKAFINFYIGFLTSVQAQGLEIQRIYFNDFLQDQPYIFIYTNVGNIWFDCNYEIKEDGKVYFTLTGATNADATLTTMLEPLLEVIVGSTKGYYIKGTGGLLQYTNHTVSLINADNPAYEINYFDF